MRGEDVMVVEQTVSEFCKQFTDSAPVNRATTQTETMVSSVERGRAAGTDIIVLVAASIPLSAPLASLMDRPRDVVGEPRGNQRDSVFRRARGYHTGRKPDGNRSGSRCSFAGARECVAAKPCPERLMRRRPLRDRR